MYMYTVLVHVHVPWCAAGGLLLDDWVTPHRGKLALLAKLPSTDVAALAGLTPPDEYFFEALNA